MTKTLIRLSAHYPEAYHNPDTLKILSVDYHEALKYWGEDKLGEACRVHIKGGKFFPKIVDLLGILESLPVSQEKDKLMLEESGSYKSEFDQNKSCMFAKIMRKLREKKITQDEAQELFRKVGAGDITDIKDIYPTATTEN